MLRVLVGSLCNGDNFFLSIFTGEVDYFLLYAKQAHDSTKSVELNHLSQAVDSPGYLLPSDRSSFFLANEYLPVMEFHNLLIYCLKLIS